MPARTVAILPVKRFAQAKQRLGDALTAAERRELAATMVADVLDALRATAALAAIVVVTNEPTVGDAARAAGAVIVADEHEDGQSPAAAAGIARARQLGAERVLLVPGDCPALDPHELDDLLGITPAEQVIIVPDRHDTGTNALLLTPPDIIAPSFGPDSRARHEALAAAAGVSHTVARPASLLHDVDSGADLGALRELLAGTEAASGMRATRTRAWLDRHASPAPTVARAGASG